jgi:hypothetical protein
MEMRDTRYEIRFKPNLRSDDPFIRISYFVFRIC